MKPTVVAARQAGPSGFVHTYEAGEKQSKHVSQTIRQNGVEDRVSIHNTAVGTTVGAFNSAENASQIDGSQLPDCDTMVIDCDGAEFDVLETLEDLPSTLIIEHHAVQGDDGRVDVEYTPDQIIKLIHDLGYDIESESEIDHIVDKNAHWVCVQ